MLFRKISSLTSFVTLKDICFLKVQGVNNKNSSKPPLKLCSTPKSEFKSGKTWDSDNKRNGDKKVNVIFEKGRRQKNTKRKKQTYDSSPNIKDIRAIEDNNNFSKELEINEYYPSVFTLPSSVTKGICENCQVEENIFKGFMIFTKHPMLPLDRVPMDFRDVNVRENCAKLEVYKKNNDKFLTRTFSDEQMQKIQLFKESLLHQILMKNQNGISEADKNEEDMFVLPCSINKSKPEVSWNFINGYLLGQWSEALTNFMERISEVDKIDSIPPDTLCESIRKVITLSQGEFGSTLKDSIKMTWEDISTFSKNLLLETKGIIGLLLGSGINPDLTVSAGVQSENIKILYNSIKSKIEKGNLKKSACQPLINCIPLKIEVRDVNKILSNISDSASASLVPEISSTISLPSYLLMEAMVFRSLTPTLQRLQHAERVRNDLAIPSEVPTQALAMAFSFYDSYLENCRRYAVLGESLLNYLLICQMLFKEKFVAQKSRWDDEPTTIPLDEKSTARKARAEVQRIIKELEGRSLFESAPKSMKSLFEETSPTRHQWNWQYVNESFDTPQFVKAMSQNMLKKVRIVQKLDAASEAAMLKNFARTAKALVGVCYKYGGLKTAIDICINFGIIEKSFMKYVSKFMIEVKNQNFSYPWERRRRPSINFDIISKISLLEKNIGYTFNNQARALQTLCHPSLHIDTRLLYRWNETVGDAFLDTLLYEHLFDVYPEMTQRNVNRLFDHLTINDVCAIIGIELHLGEVIEFHISELVSLMKEKDSVRNEDKDYRNLVTSLARYVTGAVLSDTGFDFERGKDTFMPLIQIAVKSINAEEQCEFVLAAQFVPKAIEARAFNEESQLASREFYQTIIIIESKKESPYFAFCVLTKRPLAELPAFELHPEAFPDGVKISYSNFNKKKKFKVKECLWIQDFQSKFFNPIFIPSSCVVEQMGKSVKKLYILPLTKSSKNRPWVVDWNFINSIIERNDGDTVKKNKFEPFFHTNEQKFKDFDNCIWMTPEGDIVNLPGIDYDANTESELKCSVLNSTPGDNLFKMVGSLSNSFNLKEISVDLKKCIKMPYDYGYYYWTRAIPSILHKMECQLLAEDVREHYKLAQSIPNESLVQCLLGTGAQQVTSCIELDSISNAVFRFLSTVDFYLKYRDGRVGLMSSSRNQLYSRRAYATEENMEFLKGHLIHLPFMPHKIKRPWHCPGVDPYRLYQREGSEDLIQMQASEDEEDDKEFETVFTNSCSRVSSKFYQKISIGMLDKHVKSIAAVSYLYAGIESAHNFLYQTGALTSKTYPDEKPERRRLSNKKYTNLESVLGYEFNDSSLLLRAFVHSSLDPDNSYDVLEFLGDAAIELILVSMISEKFPNESKMLLSMAKQLMESNETMARIGIYPPLELDKFIMHNNEDIAFEIMNKTEDVRKSQNLNPGSVILNKAFSDILESLVGAVLVDSGFSLSLVTRIFKPFFESYMFKWIPDKDAFEKPYLKSM